MSSLIRASVLYNQFLRGRFAEKRWDRITKLFAKWCCAHSSYMISIRHMCGGGGGGVQTTMYMMGSAWSTHTHIKLMCDWVSQIHLLFEQQIRIYIGIFMRSIRKINIFFLCIVSKLTTHTHTQHLQVNETY